jgi:CBS-domain-containing membrane protein
MKVADAMSKGVRTCKPGDPIPAAERTLAEAQIRRLPVVDEAGHLRGVLSMADIARVAPASRKPPLPRFFRSPRVERAELAETKSSSGNPHAQFPPQSALCAA